MQPLILRAFGLLACLLGAHSFIIVPQHESSTRTQPEDVLLSAPRVGTLAAQHHGAASRHILSAANGEARGDDDDDDDDDDEPPPPNLIDKDLFVTAVDTLRAEIAKQQNDGVAPLPEEKNPDDFYAIGKVKVNLNISSGNPGMDLAESTGGLVLVSGVTGHAVEAGIQTGDTIVGVAVDAADAYQETRAYCLEDTARVLMGAMKLALENGSPEIELELNRLIKMRYA